MEAPDLDELEWMAQQEGLFLQQQQEEEYMLEQAGKEEETCPEEFEESIRPPRPTGSVALTLFILLLLLLYVFCQYSANFKIHRKYKHISLTDAEVPSDGDQRKRSLSLDSEEKECK